RVGVRGRALQPWPVVMIVVVGSADLGGRDDRRGGKCRHSPHFCARRSSRRGGSAVGRTTIFTTRVGGPIFVAGPSRPQPALDQRAPKPARARTHIGPGPAWCGGRGRGQLVLSGSPEGDSGGAALATGADGHSGATSQEQGDADVDHPGVGRTGVRQVLVVAVLVATVVTAAAGDRERRARLRVGQLRVATVERGRGGDGVVAVLQGLV